MLGEDGVTGHGLVGQIADIHARLHLLQRRVSLAEEQRELLVGAIDRLHALADQVRAAFGDGGPSRAASAREAGRPRRSLWKVLARSRGLGGLVVYRAPGVVLVPVSTAVDRHPGRRVVLAAHGSAARLGMEVQPVALTLIRLVETAAP